MMVDNCMYRCENIIQAFKSPWSWFPNHCRNNLFLNALEIG